MADIETLPQTAEPIVAPETQAEPTTADIIKAAYEDQVKAPETVDEKPASERVRAPDGKFAKADDVPAIDKPAPDKVAPAAKPVEAAAEAAPVVAEAEPTQTVRPPPGWSPASKVAFDGLPESVKADIVKREAEVNQGFAKLSEYKPIEKYVDMAKQGGTTLDRALEAYTGIETLLRKDVFAGVEQVLKNVGVNPVAFAQAYLNRNGGAPQKGAPGDQPVVHQPQQIDPTAIVNQAVSAIRAEQQHKEMQSEIVKFAADPKNRFYENVKPAMAQILQAGLATNLQDAYDKACRLDPTVAPLINQPPAIVNQVAVKAAVATQARQAAKATIGSPSSGNQGGKPTPANQDTASIIKAAYEAQVGRA